MGNKIDPYGKVMPSKRGLYKGGVENSKTTKTKVEKRQNVTVTVDTLILFFPINKQFEMDLVTNRIELNNYTYSIETTIGKNPYEIYAKFYYKDIFIGNLFVEKRSKSKYSSANYNIFQLAKLRFYSSEDWAKLVEDLFAQLGIKFKIYRLDIAIDTDKDLLGLYTRYYEKNKGVIAGKIKMPTTTKNPQNTQYANVRYASDENRKIIVLYGKNFGAKKQSANENETANTHYKRVQQYQIEYWRMNGLKNIDKISRLEIRLFLKHVKVGRLSEWNICSRRKKTRKS